MITTDRANITVKRSMLNEQIKLRQDYKDWLSNGNGTKEGMKHFRRKPFSVINKK